MSRVFAFLVILFFGISHVSASSCQRLLHDSEAKYRIPRDLLHAVALVESGRRTQDGGLKSWPWTINAEGKPYILKTKLQAIQKARHLKHKGIKSMDLGPMQINSKYHPNAFSSITKAFDLRQNIDYAAKPPVQTA